MLTRSLSGSLLVLIATPALAGPPVSAPAPAAARFAPGREPIVYSLKPGRVTLTPEHERYRRMDDSAPRYSLSLTANPDVRDRFDLPALPLSKSRSAGMMSAGLQLRLTGDAGGFDTSVRVAGVVPGVMRYALR